MRLMDISFGTLTDDPCAYCGRTEDTRRCLCGCGVVVCDECLEKGNE